MNDSKNNSNNLLPVQRILFGSPGTGKSHRIHDKNTGLLKDYQDEDKFKTVFHPEYKYGDFMGRLMPMTYGSDIRYTYQPGHFMRALAKAYKNYVGAGDQSEPAKVALVVDEINRGNSSAIFGTVFQLLDRGKDGWSSYDLDLSDIEKDCLIKLMGFKPQYDSAMNVLGYEGFSGVSVPSEETLLLNNNKIRIPPNLSILATMNTSDESIYYMDSAFKRRWDWEFVPVDGSREVITDDAFKEEKDWISFCSQLNQFIKENSRHIRKVEDKLIGNFFLKEPYTIDKVQSKLMFFLWDSVFSHDKKPIEELLNLSKEPEKNVDLVTFGDFANEVKDFIKGIKNIDQTSSQND